jgi:hypothetical protein
MTIQLILVRKSDSGQIRKLLNLRLSLKLKFVVMLVIFNILKWALLPGVLLVNIVNIIT